MSGVGFEPEKPWDPIVDGTVAKHYALQSQAAVECGHADMIAKRRAKKELAERLRARATPQELLMKAWLDTKPLQTAWQFQSPLRGFICDFRCSRIKTIIELDGAYHNDGDDARRDGILWRSGYQTIRFTNDEIDSDFAAVKQRVMAAIQYELAR